MLGKYVIGVFLIGYGKFVIFYMFFYMLDYLNEEGNKSIVVVILFLNVFIED